jgi:hypothetical protein
MYLMAHPHRQGSRCYRGFECRFLGRIFAIDVSVMQNSPLIADRNDRVLSQSHFQSPVTSRQVRWAVAPSCRPRALWRAANGRRPKDQDAENEQPRSAGRLLHHSPLEPGKQSSSCTNVPWLRSCNPCPVEGDCVGPIGVLFEGGDLRRNNQRPVCASARSRQERDSDQFGLSEPHPNRNDGRHDGRPAITR